MSVSETTPALGEGEGETDKLDLEGVSEGAEKTSAFLDKLERRRLRRGMKDSLRIKRFFLPREREGRERERGRDGMSTVGKLMEAGPTKLEQL